MFFFIDSLVPFQLYSRNDYQLLLRIHDSRHKMGAERLGRREQDASVDLENSPLSSVPVIDGKYWHFSGDRRSRLCEGGVHIY